MCSAYCRAQARWLRWKEEIQLHTNVDSTLKNGCVAYAYHQQWTFESLAKKFHARWIQVLATHSLSIQWPEDLPQSNLLGIPPLMLFLAGATPLAATPTPTVRPGLVAPELTGV